MEESKQGREEPSPTWTKGWGGQAGGQMGQEHTPAWLLPRFPTPPPPVCKVEC